MGHTLSELRWQALNDEFADSAAGVASGFDAQPAPALLIGGNAEIGDKFSLSHDPKPLNTINLCTRASRVADRDKLSSSCDAIARCETVVLSRISRSFIGENGGSCV